MLLTDSFGFFVAPIGMFGFMSPRIQSPMHPAGGGRGGNRGGGMRGGRGGGGRGGISRDRELIGKSIKITGNYISISKENRAKDANNKEY